MQFWTSVPTTTSVFQTILRSWRQVNILNILHFPEYFQYPKSPEHVEYSRFPEYLEFLKFPGYLEYPEYSEVLNLEVIPRSSYTFFYQKQKALLLFVAMALECPPWGTYLYIFRQKDDLHFYKLNYVWKFVNYDEKQENYKYKCSVLSIATIMTCPLNIEHYPGSSVAPRISTSSWRQRSHGLKLNQRWHHMEY